METIRLIRKSNNSKAVRGVLRVGTQDVATLENGDYIIPAGTYPIAVTWSPKFKRMLPIDNLFVAAYDAKKVRKSMAYRLGKALLLPVSWIKKATE